MGAVMSRDKRISQLEDLAYQAQWELEEGSAEKAIEICRELVEEWTDIQGPDGETVLVWRGFLGRSLTEARRFLEAERELTALLDDRNRVLGPDHPQTLVTRGNLARAIGRGGRPQEAIEISTDLLQDRLRLMGPDHPSTFDTRGNIAQFHDLLGDFDTAALMLEELLEDRIRVLGEDHPVVMSTLHNLHVIRSRSGKTCDVQDLQVFAEEMLEDLGPDNLNVVNAFGILADAHEKRRNLDEALRVSRFVFDARSRMLGDEDARTLVTRRRIARLLEALGRSTEAIDEMMRIVELHVRAGRLDEEDCTNLIEVMLHRMHETLGKAPTDDKAMLKIRQTLLRLVGYGADLSEGPARDRVQKWIAVVHRRFGGAWENPRSL